ncbi:MAG: TolC family protein [Verrucomicrobiaceae bacterium]|nr:TolC family protein [Verrucomicrobiaceae bacterium]
MVPNQGPITERELTLLAIANLPQLEKLRGAVKVATAQQRAVRNLEEPELRVSYAYDNDNRVGEPFTEFDTSLTNSTDTFNTLTTETTLNGTTLESERGSTSTNRMRMIERRVTPGATQDVIEERIYETRDSSTSSSGSRTELGSTSPQSSSESSNRRLVATNRRVIEHPDTTGRDNAWGALVRFRVPHPWERKARILRAAAEVSLAEADYFAEEDIVVRTVRSNFQDLAILNARLATQTIRKKNCESYRDWLQTQQSPKIGLDLASARTKVYGTLTDIRSLEGEIANLRQELAAYCGLSDPTRIKTSLSPTLISQPAQLDVAYLSNIATLYRSDMLNAQARLSIAQAQLAQAKAASIPFTTFIDLGYSQQNSFRRTGQNEEWFARVGISIPIFNWLGINKQREVPLAATLSIEQQIQLQRSLIANEISQAITRLVSADSQLENCKQDLSKLNADLKKSLADSQLATADIEDLLKAKRIEQEFQDLSQQMELNRYSALSAYLEASYALEKAIGVGLERVLRRGVELPAATDVKK